MCNIMCITLPAYSPAVALSAVYLLKFWRRQKPCLCLVVVGCSPAGLPRSPHTGEADADEEPRRLALELETKVRTKVRNHREGMGRLVSIVS